MFLHKRAPPWTGLALGAIKDPTICRLSMYLCLADTKDGGMSVWLESANGTWLKKYATHDLQSEFDTATAKDGGEGNLKASCRCGGFQFEATRATEVSGQLSRVLQVFFFSFVDLGAEDKAIDSTGKSASRGTWWLRNGKYTAGLCVCDSCRLSAGCEVMAWAFIPAVNLRLNNKPLPNPPVLGTIKHYESSEGVDRYFCGRCGAVIFLIAKTRPKLLNVAVGVLQDESGARAEDWLCWKTSTGPFNAADGLKRNFLTDDLTEQMIAWGGTDN